MKAYLIFLLILPFGLFAQDWKVISVGDNSNYYIKKHSENPEDTKVWIKEEGPKIEYTNNAGKKTFIKGKHIILWDINCTDKQIALISSTVYNSLGTVLNNTVIPKSSIEFLDVIPESKGELWLNEACNLLNPEDIIPENEDEDALIEVDTIAAEEMVENIEEPTFEVDTLLNEEPTVEFAEEEVEIEPEEDVIYTDVEQQAEFPGGPGAWGRYLAKSLRYPSAAQRAKISGKVIVSFVVNTDGSIQDVELLKEIGFGCDEEALRIINSMPSWNPAKQSGRAVRSRFTQSISFVL